MQWPKICSTECLYFRSRRWSGECVRGMYSPVWACVSISFLTSNLLNVSQAVVSKIKSTKRLPILHSTALFASKRHSECFFTTERRRAIRIVTSRQVWLSFWAVCYSPVLKMENKWENMVIISNEWHFIQENEYGDLNYAIGKKSTTRPLLVVARLVV